MSVSYSAYQPSGQLGSKLEHVIITFQKNEIPLFGRAVEVVGWQSIFIVILCTLKQLEEPDRKMNPLPGQVGGRACQREGAGENPTRMISCS